MQRCRFCNLSKAWLLFFLGNVVAVQESFLPYNPPPDNVRMKDGYGPRIEEYGPQNNGYGPENAGGSLSPFFSSSPEGDLSGPFPRLGNFQDATSLFPRSDLAATYGRVSRYEPSPYPPTPFGPLKNTQRPSSKDSFRTRRNKHLDDLLQPYLSQGPGLYDPEDHHKNLPAAQYQEFTFQPGISQKVVPTHVPSPHLPVPSASGGLQQTFSPHQNDFKFQQSWRRRQAGPQQLQQVFPQYRHSVSNSAAFMPPTDSSQIVSSAALSAGRPKILRQSKVATTADVQSRRSTVNSTDNHVDGNKYSNNNVYSVSDGDSVSGQGAYNTKNHDSDSASGTDSHSQQQSAGSQDSYNHSFTSSAKYDSNDPAPDNGFPMPSRATGLSSGLSGGTAATHVTDPGLRNTLGSSLGLGDAGRTFGNHQFPSSADDLHPELRGLL